ncbi:hypothetical protein [Peredibacter starrii]|uniref:Uncharacterized protein n=1 Tax=Peredibacter starrii TaxID=28202 RepID=A0AAX4HJB8_9BACT|nr:hypothetical protein [Peredibacter starrii]WPU63315.1 hypothetical protein SOO65_11525 [Peredibacter starrii]
MAFDDLELEFEDEDESKKKKSDAVHEVVDLEFHASEASKKTPQAVPARGPATSPNIPKIQNKIAEVKKLAEARPTSSPAPVQRPTKVSSMSQSNPSIQGATALKEDNVVDLESSQVVQLREQVRKVEFEAEVKVAVAEFKAEVLGEMLGDMKLLEHQIGQLLARINAKHPDVKQEALMIKKLLADFTAKKRK